jgi:mRNA interferase ChpB
MRRGDIYLVSLDPTHGHEQKVRRPVLIVSADAFNKATGTPIVVPIASGASFARSRGYAVSITGIGTTGVIRCDPPRALDIKARNGRKIDDLPKSQVEEVMARLITLFE